MDKNYIDLYDLQTRLKAGVEAVFPSRVWLKAEISAIKARPGGHCYIELSQSGQQGLVAKAQAVIWSSRYSFISPFFKSVTGSALAEGMSVLVQVSVNFSQLYGLSLVINDIDPDFSLGEKEREKRMTIARLTEEGLMEMQKTLHVPALPYRIAVISAPDAAGYRDFVRHLEENEYGFVFDLRLFPALMQGPDCPASIISALEAIDESSEPFDIVLILRGGGSRLDLACFDDYSLCSNVAQFPCPVFTAVGHDQDFHVCDMVSCVSVKTPTALADEIVSYYEAEDARILSYAGRLKLAFSGKISAMESRVNILETKIHASDPRNIVRRGYVLALSSSGVPVKSVRGVSAGDSVSLMFMDGVLDCEVKGVEDVK